MGRESALKDLRKQLRVTTKEILPDVLNAELVSSVGDKVAKQVDTRLDSLTEAVMKEVKKIDDQTQVFRSMVMRDCGMQISNELLNINVTMLAWQQVITKECGFTVEELEKKVEDAKIDIRAKLEAEAKKKQEEAEAAEKAAKEAQAAEDAKKAAEAAANGVPVNPETAQALQEAVESKLDDAASVKTVSETVLPSAE